MPCDQDGISAAHAWLIETLFNLKTVTVVVYAKKQNDWECQTYHNNSNIFLPDLFGN